MSTDRNRDHVTEALLRQSLDRSTPAAGQGPCVDGETLAAWFEGGLDRPAAGQVELHVADCARCQAMLATFIRSDVDEAAGEPARHWHWHWRWLVPLTSAAAAVLIWMVVPESGAPTRPALAPEGVVARTDSPAESPASIAPKLESPASPPAPAPEARVAPARTSAPQGEAVANRQPQPRQEAESRLVDASPTQRGRDALGRAEPAEEKATTAAARVAAAVAAPSPLVIMSPEGDRWRLVDGRRVEFSPAARGERWEVAELPSPVVLSAGSSPGNGVCWVVGTAGAVFLTTDGRRFSRVPFIEPVDLVHVVAQDGRRASVQTADGRRFSTLDGGATWGQ
ncbi:MAG: hypothetical protein ACT4QD_15460 [Acidobacteriota bacterium]